MKLERILSFMLCAAMLLSLLTGCGGNTEPGDPAENFSPETEIEIQTAIDLGLVPEELQKDYGKQIQYNEFVPMMTNVIALRYGEGEYLDKWLEVSAIAAERDALMLRGEGAGVIFAAAVTVGMDDYHSKAASQRDLDGETQGAAIEYVPDMSDMFPFMAEAYYNFNWGEEYENHYLGAERYPWHRYSPASGKTLLDIDTEIPSMRYEEPFTRAEAICAALRCYESWTQSEYVSIKDSSATNYDVSIITDDLLKKESSLPEVTHNVLPADWQGMCIYEKGNTKYSLISPFKERNMKFLAENDMNYARVYLGFSTLRYPDFPEDGTQVNLMELRELDQMLAWAMEYDVHMSLCMLTPPGYRAEEDTQYQSIGDDNWPDADRWQLIHDYWIMLAERYKNIPSKNLTFELCTEWGSDDRDHLRDFRKNWTEIIADIREVSSDRVLIAGFDLYSAGKQEMADTMASLGVSLAAHPYFPAELAFYGREDHIYGIGDYLTWPMPYFPTADFDNGRVPLTISGNIGGTTLSVYATEGHVWGTETGDPVLTVAADGKVIDSFAFENGAGAEHMTVSIPEGAKEVTITHTGYIRLYCLKAEGDFGTKVALTTDSYDSSLGQGAAELVLDEEGNWADAKGRLYDTEAVFTDGLKPYMDTAEKYSVGFMVNEFVFAQGYEDTNVPQNLDTQMAYYADCIDFFEENEIGYALNFMDHGVIGLIGDERDKYNLWSNYSDYVGTQTYTYDNGFSETFPVNNTLVNLIREHMSN